METFKPFQEIKALSQRLDVMDVSKSEVKSTYGNIISRVMSGNHTEETGRSKVICQAWLRGFCKDSKVCKFFHDEQALKLPGCYLCFKYNGCWDSHCKYCIRGFCMKGSQCSNIYNQYGKHMRTYETFEIYRNQNGIRERGFTGQQRSVKNKKTR